MNINWQSAILNHKIVQPHDITPLSTSLKDLATFISTTDKGLTVQVEEGDYTGLVDVMGHLMAVRDRQSATDEMFEPLKKTIELLKTYDQEMPEEVHVQLQVWKGGVGCVVYLCTTCFTSV